MRLEDHMQLAWRSRNRLVELRRISVRLGEDCAAQSRELSNALPTLSGSRSACADESNVRRMNALWAESARGQFTNDANPQDHPEAVFVCGAVKTDQMLAACVAQEWLVDRGGAALLSEGLIAKLHPAPESLPTDTDSPQALGHVARQLMAFLLLDVMSRRLNLVATLPQGPCEAFDETLVALETSGYRVTVIHVAASNGENDSPWLQAVQDSSLRQSIRVIRLPEPEATSSEHRETKDKRAASSRRIQINEKHDPSKTLKRESEVGTHAATARPVVPVGQTMASIPPAPAANKPASQVHPTREVAAEPVRPTPTAAAPKPERSQEGIQDEGTERRRQMQLLIRKKADKA